MTDLEQIRIDPALTVRLPKPMAVRKGLLPLAAFDGAVHVACAREPDELTAATVRRFFHPVPVIWEPADPLALRRAIVRVYGAPDEAEASGEDPVALADALFRAARLRRASDIHLNPVRNGLEVRFRVDGRLETYRTLPAELRLPLVNRVKVLAKLDIAERRSPQDGGFELPPMPGDSAGTTDVRVATLPVKYGERVTLRLLAAERATLTLETLGMRAEHLKTVTDVLESPHGLVLLTGPTGSGKSTTLYAAIRRLLDRAPLNVLTVEDPIEYEIEGAQQSEVDSADKVSFAKALRSLLRHDPDVVMIGEIRDEESLDVAVKAALTGHLVLSSLHTNSAVGAVTRLADMGLAPHLVAATLRLAIAQRLVRKLCAACGGKGCLACAGRGYAGRTALFELFAPDEQARALIARGTPETALVADLLSRGYETLADDAERKIAAGVTSREEVYRVL